MNVSLIVTVVGPDRPGIVSLLSERGQALGANWEESRMASVAGQFAGIVHLRVPVENAERLSSALSELESRGLRVVVVKGEGASPPKQSRVLKLEVVGQDRRGIVRDLSSCLSSLGVSIAELHTEFTSAAMSAENLFKATALLRVPEGLGVDALRNRLEILASDAMVDLAAVEDGALTEIQDRPGAGARSPRR